MWWKQVAVNNGVSQRTSWVGSQAEVKVIAVSIGRRPVCWGTSLVPARSRLLYVDYPTARASKSSRQLQLSIRALLSSSRSPMLAISSSSSSMKRCFYVNTVPPVPPPRSPMLAHDAPPLATRAPPPACA